MMMMMINNQLILAVMFLWLSFFFRPKLKPGKKLRPFWFGNGWLRGWIEYPSRNGTSAFYRSLTYRCRHYSSARVSAIEILLPPALPRGNISFLEEFLVVDPISWGLIPTFLLWGLLTAEHPRSHNHFTHLPLWLTLANIWNDYSFST